MPGVIFMGHRQTDWCKVQMPVDGKRTCKRVFKELDKSGQIYIQSDPLSKTMMCYLLVEVLCQKVVTVSCFIYYIFSP